MKGRSWSNCICRTEVAGSVIPDVTTVPFYYGYSLPEDQAAGELKVELTVQGETGVTASTSSTVILAIDLGPQPPKVGTMTDSVMVSFIRRYN